MKKLSVLILRVGRRTGNICNLKHFYFLKYSFIYIYIRWMAGMERRLCSTHRDDSYFIAFHASPLMTITFFLLLILDDDRLREGKSWDAKRVSGVGQLNTQQVTQKKREKKAHERKMTVLSIRKMWVRWRQLLSVASSPRTRATIVIIKFIPLLTIVLHKQFNSKQFPLYFPSHQPFFSLHESIESSS